MVKAKEKKKEFETIGQLRSLLESQGNAEQVAVLDAIENTRDHILVLGAAGSGKTTFMKRLRQALPNCVVVAPTGVAAVNAEGQTMHSFFLLDTKPYSPRIVNGNLDNTREEELPTWKKGILRKVDTVIIDEISMVRPDVLDYVSDTIRSARRRGGKDQFRGVRIIMFGDMEQLPPVVNGGDPIKAFYGSRYFFESYALRMSGFRVFRFNSLYRQRDPEFIKMLNGIRLGDMTEESIELLKSRMVGEDPEGKAIVICSTNEEARKINEAGLDSIDGTAYSSQMECYGDTPKGHQYEETLRLKIGARVVITVNGVGYYNGSMGNVTGLTKGLVFIRLDDGTEVEIGKYHWKKMKYRVSLDGIDQEETGWVEQYPIKLGYAVTAHKSQGMTFDRIEVRMSRAFERGQIYTALSRCRTLDGVYIVGEPNMASVVRDDDIERFYETVKDGALEAEDPFDLADELEARLLRFRKESRLASGPVTTTA